jgi:hypothetical protein
MMNLLIAVLALAFYIFMALKGFRLAEQRGRVKEQALLSLTQKYWRMKEMIVETSPPKQEGDKKKPRGVPDPNTILIRRVAAEMRKYPSGDPMYPYWVAVAALLEYHGKGLESIAEMYAAADDADKEKLGMSMSDMQEHWFGHELDIARAWDEGTGGKFIHDSRG